MPHNKENWPSTGFYEAAARSVHGVAVGGDAVITADKLGLRQRLLGGPITARNVQNITIPICAEAYGTTVADWGIENLVLVILADGRKFLALWLGWEGAQSSFRKQVGKLHDAFDPHGTDASRKRAAKGLWQYAATTANRVGKFRATLAGYKQALAEIAPGRSPGAAKKPNVIMFKAGGGNTVARAEKHANLQFLFVLKHSVEQAGNPLVIPPDIQEFAIEQVKIATEIPA